MNHNVDLRKAVFIPAAIGSDETKAVFTMRPGERVLFSSSKLLQAADASTTSTVTLGDGVDPDGFIKATDLDLETATIRVLAQGTGAYLDVGGGKLYTVADTIDVVYANGTEGATLPIVEFRIAVYRED